MGREETEGGDLGGGGGDGRGGGRRTEGRHGKAEQGECRQPSPFPGEAEWPPHITPWEREICQVGWTHRGDCGKVSPLL